MPQHTTAQPARSGAFSHLPPVRGFAVPTPGRTGPAAAGHELSRIAISPPRAPAAAAPIQRVIKVGGNDIDIDQLTNGRDAREIQILQNWHGSTMEHNFGDHGKLNAAVASAKDQPEDTPDLYQAKNLRFRTSAPNREETLYFTSGKDSSRIRQQHPSGPAVIEQQNKRDFFFKKKADMRAFLDEARRAKRADRRFQPWKAKKSGTLNFRGISQMQERDRHLEVTFGADNTVSKLHRSQGRVRKGRRGYSDWRIRDIRRKALGYPV